MIKIISFSYIINYKLVFFMVKLIRHSPVGSLISEACIAKIGKQLLFSLLCIFLTDTATSRLCHLFFS